MLACIGGAVYMGNIYFKEKNMLNSASKADETIVAEVVDEDDDNPIDWEKVKAMSPNIIGWIMIPGTKINYPILKGDDNEHYLTNNYADEYDVLGSIFMDYRQSADMTDLNTFIYGHTVNPDAPSPKFGELNKYFNQDYFNEHKTVFIYTPTEAFEGTVFAVSTDSVNTKSREWDFKDREAMIEYAKFMEDKSAVKSDYDVSDISQMFTLWACTEEEITNSNNEYVPSNLSRTFISIGVK